MKGTIGFGVVLRGVIDRAEQREEDRHLQDQGKAGGERVGARLLPQLHLLLRQALTVVLVLLLERLDLRLEQLHGDRPVPGQPP